MKPRTRMPVMFTVVLLALFFSACGAGTGIPIPSMTPIPSGWSVYQIPKYGVKFSYPTIYDKGFRDGLESDYYCGVTVHEAPKDVQYSMTIGIIDINVIETEEKVEDFTNAIVSAMSEDWDIEVSELYTEKDVYAFQIYFFNRSLPRSGVRTYLGNRGFIFEIEIYDVPFINCESNEIGYSNYWVYEQMLNSIEFEKIP